MSFALRLCLFVVLVLTTATNSNAQDTAIQIQVEFSSKWNRAQLYLNMVNNKAGSELELTEEQGVQLKELQAEYELKKLAIREVFERKTESERTAGLVEIQGQVESLLNILDKEILLPHQVALIKKEEFENLLLFHDGDFIKLVTQSYGEDLKLSDAQKEKIKQAREDKRKKAEAARMEFQKKMLEIDKEFKAALGKTLTAEQETLIKKYSGKSSLPTGMSDVK